MSKRLLLIAHKFPPFKGVGAIRWTHLSQHLAQRGHKIELVTVERGMTPELHPNITLHKVPSDPFYKMSQFKFSHPVLNGVWYKCMDVLRKLFWYDDEAQYWGRYLKPYCQNLIEDKDIQVVIATGAPFQANRYAAEIKATCPKVKLIQDWRDEWSDTPGKHYLFSYQQQNVLEWERQAISIADMNVFVTSGLKTLMNRGHSDNCTVITNGSPFLEYPVNVAKEAVWIHAGTLGNGRDKVAEPFFELIQRQPEVLQGAKVLFYGRIAIWLKNKYKDLFQSGLFVHKEPIPQAELLSEISKARVALQFNALNTPFALSTKIFEYPSLGTPVLSVNGGGDIADFLDQNEIGEYAKPDQKQILAAIERLYQKEKDYKLQQVSSGFTYDKIAKQYSDLIEALVS